jgi:hypothetical protein
LLDVETLRRPSVSVHHGIELVIIAVTIIITRSPPPLDPVRARGYARVSHRKGRESCFPRRPDLADLAATVTFGR